MHAGFTFHHEGPDPVPEIADKIIVLECLGPEDSVQQSVVHLDPA